MKIRLNIAKYKENVDWASNFKLGTVCVINKDNTGLSNFDDYQIINSNHINIALHPYGYEMHSYYLHILNQYDSLNDWEIFCQGNPFDHCTDFLEKINNIKTFECEYGYIEFSWLPHIIQRFYGIPKDQEKDYTENIPDLYNRKNRPYGSSKSLLRSYFFVIPPETACMQPFGMFAVKKENILRHNKECYRRLIYEKFNPNHPAGEPEVRFALEYGQHIIFDGRYYQ